jgi:hypothetical protein
MTRISWPGDARFAFSIFDDPDAQTEADGRLVYSFLADLGFRTTKAVWPTRGALEPSDRGETCDEPSYRRWALELQERGFEIAYHNATLHTSTREQTIAALARFEEVFGRPPQAMANHFFSMEAIYWGDARLTGARRWVYNLLTRGANRKRFHGHVEGHPLFWGDVCRDRVQYVRNFVFGEVNTLKACPYMPYYDPLRPYVNLWFAASEGSNRRTFVRTLRSDHLDSLEAEGGASIVYTHFGHGFVEGGRLADDFRQTMEGIARRRGWLVTVSELLDYLRDRRGAVTISDEARAALEWRWLGHKTLFGTA